MFYFIADFGIYNLVSSLSLLSNNIYDEMNKNDILLLGGDNFYPMGVEKNDDLDKFGKFFNKYNNNIYGVLGNHDYFGRIKYQMIGNKYFKIPNHYYKLNQNNIDVYMIDTTLISPISDTNLFDVLGNIDSNRLFDIMSNKKTSNDKKISNVRNFLFKKRRELLEWLDINMNYSKKNNKKIIVIGHYPIFSYGTYEFQNKENVCLKHLIPLFLKHKVNSYISGHDHSNQHFKIPAKKLLNIFNSILLTLDDDLVFIDKILTDISKNNNLFNYNLNSFICGTSVQKYNVYNNKKDDICKINNVNFNCYLKIFEDGDKIHINYIDSVDKKIKFNIIV
tara:strand:- start:1656 stop:2660 length:1005 start_codon:yes stop_codon:yes gene_type:complete